MILNSQNNKNVSLRSLLESEGYSFPCGGKGLCGKCRIVAPTLPITELDKRFLSNTELDLGERLACNKIISEPLEIIEIKLPKHTPVAKVKEGGIVALLYPSRTELTLTDMEGETAVESLILPTANARAELRSIVGKNSVELFEKYNLATAPTMIMAGDKAKIQTLLGSESIEDGSLNAVEYALPGDELYLAGISDFCTGTSLMEVADEPDGTLLVELSESVVSVVFKEGIEAKAFMGSYEEALAFANAQANVQSVVIVGGDVKGLFTRAFPGGIIRSPKANAYAVSMVTSVRRRAKIRSLVAKLS